MEISCADCGCLVDRGVIVSTCADHPTCCCGELPIQRRIGRTVGGEVTSAGDGPPTWSTWQEAAGVVCYRPHLRKTAAIALIVGTILFCINQLDVVLRGDATAVVWIKTAVTYVVPFAVSNLGVLVASRVDRPGSPR